MVLESQEQFDASVSGPITDKTPGDPDWCWQLTSALQHLWGSLHLDLDLYLGAWADADEHRIWEKVPYDNPYGTKEAMLEGLKVGDDEAALKRMKVQAIAARAKRIGRQGHSNGKGSLDYLSRGSDYLVARIARDAPDVLERMKAGEFESVRAAAREAGIELATPKRTVTLSDNVERVADRLRSHYTPDQLQRISARLAEEETQAD